MKLLITLFLFSSWSIESVSGVVEWDCKKSPNIEKLRWVVKADPVRDATQAIMKNDFRFRAVQGYSVILPGVPEREWQRYTKKYGIIVIEGTTDSFGCAEHVRLHLLAVKYAEKYNIGLLKHIDAKHSNKSSEKDAQ